MSNLEHLSRPLFEARDISARYLSRFEPPDTVLFYTSLGVYSGMPRKLVWIEQQNLQGFGCSECNWLFKPSSALLDESLDRMKEKYEAQRDKEFVAHVCVKPGRVTNPKIG